MKTPQIEALPGMTPLGITRITSPDGLRFQVGKTYATRSIGDHDCIHSFKIIARTAKTVVVNVNGKTVLRRLSTWNGVEQFKPFGNYSMCAVISADKLAA